jgi:hypothetical protein
MPMAMVAMTERERKLERMACVRACWIVKLQEWVRVVVGYRIQR